MTAPQIDRRMDIWFGEDEVFDLECKKEFASDIEMASAGDLNHWAADPRGRLALILLLDQFRRNIYRGSPKAFEKDRAALKLCVEGAMQKKDYLNREIYSGGADGVEPAFCITDNLLVVDGAPGGDFTGLDPVAPDL